MIFDVLHTLAWAVALTALLASAWTDLKDRIIPNELVGLIAVAGLCLSLMLRPEQTWISLMAAALVLIGLGVLAHWGVMGGGDVKLISATTLLVPPDHVGQLMVFIAMSGGLLSGVYLLGRHLLRSSDLRKSVSYPEAGGERGGNSEGWFSGECARVAAGGSMPYALAILGGVAGVIAGEIPQCLSANFCSF